MFRVTNVSLLLVLVLAPWPVVAGDIDSPANPDDPAGAMFTLEDIFNRLDTGAAGAERGTGFVEPLAGPDSTGRTRPWSRSSTRITNRPPRERIDSHARSAVEALPRWISPVGLGA